MNGRRLLYGMLAEFESEHSLLDAVRRTMADGYSKVEAYAPYPIDDLPDALRLPRSRMPVLMFAGGLVGALAAFGLQYYCSVLAYPMNVGGRPLNSWPAFVPVIFELTVLFGALFGVVGMIALNGLPRPHHPLFAVPEFDRASQDRFFLCIEAADPKFERRATRDFLASLSPSHVVEVPE